MARTYADERWLFHRRTSAIPYQIPTGWGRLRTEATAGSPTWQSALVDLSAELCQGNCRVRLLRGGHGEIPHTVRIRCHRARHTPSGPCQCDRDPSADWTVQQWREAVGFSHADRYLIGVSDWSGRSASIRNCAKLSGLGAIARFQPRPGPPREGDSRLVVSTLPAAPSGASVTPEGTDEKGPAMIAGPWNSGARLTPCAPRRCRSRSSRPSSTVAPGTSSPSLQDPRSPRLRYRQAPS